jgi:hypothetical protein
MRDYKILMPVTGSPELVKAKINAIPDLSKLIIVNNLDNPEVAELTQYAVAQGAEGYHFPYNLGLAATWNIGLRRMYEDDCTFVLIISPSLDIGGSFQNVIDATMECFVEHNPIRVFPALATSALHCFAQGKRSVDELGYFDENFWPIYYEDTDYTRRHNVLYSSNNMNEQTEKKTVFDLAMNDYIKSTDASIALNSDPRLLSLYQHNSHRINEYYQRKWGGDHLSETFEHPFDDSKMTIRDWTIDKPFYHKLSENESWLPPDRYPYVERRLK